jgi:hypothetical protein
MSALHEQTQPVCHPLSPWECLPRQPFVIDQKVLAPFDVSPDGCDHFIFGHIRRHHAARNLSFCVYPFDNSATSTPGLLDWSRYSASTQVERRM